MSRLLAASIFVLVLAGLVGAPLHAQGTDPATLARIRDGALATDWAYQRLGDLADLVGPRLSGSPGAAAAVAQVAANLKAAGLEVRLQPIKVPHWVRGEERGELVEYAGRPKDVTQRVVLTALGGSNATPAGGLTAPVLVFRSMAELEARAADVKGKIVLVSVPFDQHLADNGFAGDAYGQAGLPRFRAPAMLSKLGAAAALVRSVGGANYRVPHTGGTFFPDGVAPIPSAALTAEDAMLIERLATRGPVTMKLVLTSKTLPDADSHNVIADLRGREKPDEVVIVSGHLDSWDLGTGAMDDGMGVTAAMGAVALLKQLAELDPKLVPRRTLRVIAWMNEENGGRGGEGYFESVKASLGTQVAAIESDFGLGLPLGIRAAVDEASAKALDPVMQSLRAIGAGVLQRRDGETGADIALLQRAGVPAFAPLVDGRHYFDLHHTPADTFDKIDPEAMRRQVAVLAVLAYFLAERDDPLKPITTPVR